MEISKATARKDSKVSVRSAQNAPKKSVNLKTHFCPRCKQDRLKEWFGDPKAPYAICLSCRVELNGERKKEAVAVKLRRANCAICARLLDERDRDLCIRCEAGLNSFDRNHKLLARGAAYLIGNLRKPGKKEHRKRPRARNKKLQRLISEQAQDDKERGLRFEHAISKP
jgi:RNA polymerase subunit RPABC4/transcription elongation factor Spt4